VFCGNGIILKLRLEVGMKPFNVHDERSMEDWDWKGGSSVGKFQLLRSEYQAEVLWIDAGIVTIPLFEIDVPLSSQCIRFGSEFSGKEMDEKVESRKVFGPSSLSMCEDLGH